MDIQYHPKNNYQNWNLSRELRFFKFCLKNLSSGILLLLLSFLKPENYRTLENDLPNGGGKDSFFFSLFSSLIT